MNVYTCSSFTGHWPVGVAAVIVADDIYAARAALEKRLKVIGLDQRVDLTQLDPVDVEIASVRILCDGDY